MTLSDKIVELRQHREAIREAIVAKGGILPLGSHMSDYPSAIETLSGGGEGGFDTSQIIRADYMFYNYPLSNPPLNLNGLDMSNVINMTSMFERYQHTTLDLSGFNTSNVTNMTNMFGYCKATTLDLSSFDTTKVTSMNSMFYNSETTTIDFSSFDTSNVTNMGSMFSGSSATTLDLSSFDTTKVTSMNSMFRNSKATTGYARTQADADKFNASSNKPAGLTFVVKPEPTE